MNDSWEGGKEGEDWQCSILNCHSFSSLIEKHREACAFLMGQKAIAATHESAVEILNWDSFVGGGGEGGRSCASLHHVLWGALYAASDSMSAQ